MLKGALARRYAQALFEIAANDLNKVESELQTVVNLIEGNEDVQHILHHPHVSMTDKKTVMDKLLANQASEIVRNFVYLLIDRRRQGLIAAIQKEFGRLADEARNIIEAKVSSANALSLIQESRLQQELTRLTGKNVRMVTELRPDLIGGVLVQIGDRVIDGTVAHKLTRMREELRKA